MFCEDRVLNGPTSGSKGSKGRNKLDCRTRSSRFRPVASLTTPPIVMFLSNSDNLFVTYLIRKNASMPLQGYLVHKKTQSPRTLQ